jgi:4-hydroxybenzoate-CoA ligase
MLGLSGGVGLSERGMSADSGSYNAVTWLLDRNVDEGRGGKLAFTDTVRELTYSDLQKQTRRGANMLRRLGVRREERVAMIMLDTTDFPIVFLGAIRAGVVPVPLNTLLTSDQYAYARPDAGSRTCRCVGPKRTRLQATVG